MSKDILDFNCPICKKDIEDIDDVILADSDNLDSFSLDKGPKTFVHSKCYQDSKKEKE